MEWLAGWWRAGWGGGPGGVAGRVRWGVGSGGWLGQVAGWRGGGGPGGRGGMDILSKECSGVNTVICRIPNHLCRIFYFTQEKCIFA